ncbi:MAG TPA: cupin domain-containing protein, partial [Thermoanaerobaculia bacterium]|nr:cupin domain-containing protein [Thermoanaerobaculia bacterium]
MIANWLGAMPRETFLREHFQRAPIAQPKLGRAIAPLLDWKTVSRLVAARADMLLVRNSKLRLEEAPVTFEDVQTLFRDGYSVVLRHCEQHDPGLRAVADAFARELPGQVVVQVYATPGDFHSFSWHYDVEDVFIVQATGTKDYFLRENTINPRPTLAAMPKDMQYERETTPTVGATLIAGDCLYIPRGWWHVAKAREDSLSISIGVLSPDA